MVVSGISVVGIAVNIDIDIVILDEADGSGLDVFSSVGVADENIDVFVSNGADVDGSAAVLATDDVNSMAPDECICVFVSHEVVAAGTVDVVNVVVNVDASGEGVVSFISDLALVEALISIHVVFPA